MVDGKEPVHCWFNLGVCDKFSVNDLLHAEGQAAVPLEQTQHPGLHVAGCLSISRHSDSTRDSYPEGVIVGQNANTRSVNSA